MKTIERTKRAVTPTLLSLVLGFSLLVAAYQAYAGDDEHTKKYSREFNVNRDAALYVSNKFGEIICQNWDKNAVSVNVLVSVETSNEKKALEYLDRINVSITGNESRVEAVTEFSGDGNFRNTDFSIDYMIMLPKTLSLELINKFGEIVLDEAEGTVKIDLSYGELEANSLSNKENELKLQFGEGDIEFLESGEIKVSYSELEIKGSVYLDISSSFSELDIENAGELKIDSQYDDFTIERVGRLNLASKFSDVEIDNLDDNFVVDIQYGDLTLDNVAAIVGRCEIYNAFADVSLTVAPSATFFLDGEAKYGSITFPAGRADISERESGYTTKYYEGVVGKGEKGENVLYVRARNASVNID